LKEFPYVEHDDSALIALVYGYLCSASWRGLIFEEEQEEAVHEDAPWPAYPAPQSPDFFFNGFLVHVRLYIDQETVLCAAVAEVVEKYRARALSSMAAFIINRTHVSLVQIRNGIVTHSQAVSLSSANDFNWRDVWDIGTPAGFVLLRQHISPSFAPTSSSPSSQRLPLTVFDRILDYCAPDTFAICERVSKSMRQLCMTRPKLHWPDWRILAYKDGAGFKAFHQSGAIQTIQFVLSGLYPTPNSTALKLTVGASERVVTGVVFEFEEGQTKKEIIGAT